jgi:hypothetical protein
MLALMVNQRLIGYILIITHMDGCYGDTSFGDNNESIKFDYCITKNNCAIYIFYIADAVIKLNKNNVIKTIDCDTIIITSKKSV